MPTEKWEYIIYEKPEYREMKTFANKLPFGHFVILMIAAGLNGYMLKGNADIYWKSLRKYLENRKNFKTFDELKEILIEFYKGERLSKLKFLLSKGIKL